MSELLALQAVEPRMTALRLLPPDPALVGPTRRWVRATLPRWGLDGCVDLAQLVVSELVANAVRHGEGLIEVRLSRAPAGLVIEVRDAGAGHPAPRRAGDAETSGRGLALIEDLLAAHGGCWGVRVDPDPGPGADRDGDGDRDADDRRRARPGKTVYAVLPLPPP